MTVDPRLQRIWDSYTLGFRPIKPTDLRWIAAFTEAAAIASHFHDRYTPDFGDVVKPSPHLKLPPKYVDGTHVAVPHHLILSLETTWAELDYQAHELEMRAAEIMDEVLRAKIQQTIREVKEELDRRKRAHLKVVP